MPCRDKTSLASTGFGREREHRQVKAGNETCIHFVDLYKMDPFRQHTSIKMSMFSPCTQGGFCRMLQVSRGEKMERDVQNSRDRDPPHAHTFLTPHLPSSLHRFPRASKTCSSSLWKDLHSRPSHCPLRSLLDRKAAGELFEKPCCTAGSR